MKVLYFGDVYAKPGRDAVKKAIEKWVGVHQIDFVVINGENAAHGNGITPELAEEMYEAGVDVITTGNHAWDQKQIIPYMSQTTRLIRPLNYPDVPAYKTPGRGSTVVDSKRGKLVDGKPLRLGVLQVMGRVFMDALDCPFRAAEREAERLSNIGVDCILVDFHGEATSEKQAFSYYMDGKVSAVVGSHSHVQTADERILAGGTAAITDVG
ncbi:MAG: YmdB family metallophosphoesterase, partial [Proteobacteria bacterium]